jgi:hypothetical protein
MVLSRLGVSDQSSRQCSSAGVSDIFIFVIFPSWRQGSRVAAGFRLVAFPFHHFSLVLFCHLENIGKLDRALFCSASRLANDEPRKSLVLRRPGGRFLLVKQRVVERLQKTMDGNLTLIPVHQPSGKGWFAKSFRRWVLFYSCVTAYPPERFMPPACRITD